MPAPQEIPQENSVDQYNVNYYTNMINEILNQENLSEFEICENLESELEQYQRDELSSIYPCESSQALTVIEDAIIANNVRLQPYLAVYYPNYVGVEVFQAANPEELPCAVVNPEEFDDDEDFDEDIFAGLNDD